MKALLALIKKLYGSKALSKTIGTRTNIITLPDKDTKRFLTNELNIDAASDAAIEKAYKDVEKLIPDIPKMNDQEILTLTGNLQRLDNRLNPPSAEIIDIGTKKPVTGIKQLAAEQGLPEGTDPNSLMGRLLTAANKLKAESKQLKTPSEDPLKDLLTKGPGSYDWQREGIVRTGAREILEKNLKSGKLKLKDPYEEKMIKEFRQGGVDPIEVFRREYGEGALEQLDDIADDLLPAQSYKEINDILNKNKLFDLKQLSDEAKASAKESSDYADEIMKQVREGKIKNLADEPKVIPADSPEGKEITEALIGKPKAQVTELLTAEKIIADMNKMDPMDAMYEANKVLKKEGKYKNLKDEDVQKIMSETEDNIFERNIPDDRDDFAGGGVAYLMGL